MYLKCMKTTEKEKKQMSLEALHLTVPDDMDSKNDTVLSTIHTGSESNDSACD